MELPCPGATVCPGPAPVVSFRCDLAARPNLPLHILRCIRPPLPIRGSASLTLYFNPPTSRTSLSNEHPPTGPLLSHTWGRSDREVCHVSLGERPSGTLVRWHPQNVVAVPCSVQFVIPRRFLLPPTVLLNSLPSFFPSGVTRFYR